MHRNVSTPNLIADNIVFPQDAANTSNLLGGPGWQGGVNMPRNVSTPNLNRDPFADLGKVVLQMFIVCYLFLFVQ